MREIDVTCDVCGLSVVVVVHEDGAPSVEVEWAEFRDRCQVLDTSMIDVECPALVNSIRRRSVNDGFDIARASS